MMRSIVVAVLIAQAFVVSGRAQVLDLKPGAWEMTTRVGMPTLPPSGPFGIAGGFGSPIPLAGFGNRMPSASKVCMKKQDVEDGPAADPPSGCDVDIVTRTATELVVKSTCADGKAFSIALEAHDPEHLAGVIDAEMGGRGQLHLEYNGKWVSESCDGIGDRRGSGWQSWLPGLPGPQLPGLRLPGLPR